jgi:hypothetical protein
VHPGKIFFELIDVDDQDDEDQVRDDRDPRGFAAARAREVVLQLDEEMRNAGIVIHILVGSFPFLAVVEAKLLRLRLFGRSHRVLEWNLRDGHELSYSRPRLVR